MSIQDGRWFHPRAEPCWPPFAMQDAGGVWFLVCRPLAWRQTDLKAWSLTVDGAQRGVVLLGIANFNAGLPAPDSDAGAGLVAGLVFLLCRRIAANWRDRPAFRQRAAPSPGCWRWLLAAAGLPGASRLNCMC